jgi:hypothetical protein
MHDENNSNEIVYILKYEKVRVDTLLKSKKLKMVKKDGVISFEYIGDLEKAEIEQSKANNTKARTTKEAAQDFILSKLKSDKLSGVDGTLKATILGDAVIQGLNLRAVERELQALVRDKEVSSQKEGGNQLYRLVQDKPESTNN